MILLGVDWAEDDHDLTVMDPEGRVLATARIAEGLDGVAQLHALVADHADDPDEVAVGIEIDRGLLVTSLVAAGYAVYAVNPKAVERYRDRHAVSGRNLTLGTARPWPTWSAPTGTTTGPSPATPSWPKRSRSPPGRTRA